MRVRTTRKGHHGSVIVVGNKHTVSVKTTVLDAVRLTPQQARDVAHALLQSARDVDGGTRR
jgi:hypothetical protein